MASHNGLRQLQVAPGALSKVRTVVVIWQRFGPYHLARLRGASDAVRSDDWRVVGVEVAGHDHYNWIAATDSSVERHTLFPDENYSRLAPRRIRKQVGRVLTQLDPDAVCINGWSVPEAAAALRWCRSSRVPAILMSETFESSANLLKRTVKRWRVASCQSAIVGGDLQARYLETLGLDRSRMALGYDVVDNIHFSTPRRHSPSWSEPVKATRYFFANTRFLERKGIDDLLRAYARYRELGSALPGAAEPWRLVISGSGEMERPWKMLSSRLGIAQFVQWPGFIQYADLPAAYQSAGAFVHPARREPWGLVVNEAAAAGLPLLIGHRVGAAFELLRDGENGFLIDPDNLESFARRLLYVADLSDDERASMGRRSKQLVSAFGPERFGHALRECLGLER
jgi:1,2-diacylglycerol 3-alpha-glucosyltransferase